MTTAFKRNNPSQAPTVTLTWSQYASHCTCTSYFYYLTPQKLNLHTNFGVTDTLFCAFSTALSCLSKCCEMPDGDFQSSHIFSLVLFFSPSHPLCIICCVLFALRLLISFSALLKKKQCNHSGGGFQGNIINASTQSYSPRFSCVHPKTPCDVVCE